MESQSDQENSERKRPGVERVYQNDKITVLWEPQLCIHTGNCTHGLPEVFQPQTRPWVHLDAAEVDQIVAVIRTCPTGALHFEVPAGDVPDVLQSPTTIEARPNGPLYVRGPVRVIERGGKLIREDTRLALSAAVIPTTSPFVMAVIAGLAFEPRHLGDNTAAQVIPLVALLESVHEQRQVTPLTLRGCGFPCTSETSSSPRTRRAGRCV